MNIIFRIKQNIRIFGGNNTSRLIKKRMTRKNVMRFCDSIKTQTAQVAAVFGLTKSCVMNFSPYIRVNAVAPTMVSTPMMDTVPDWR